MKSCCLQNYESSCPLFETHDKFIESWYFLCSMVENYHNAKLFRWYLNAFIQSLRNVTFMLQSEKSKIPDFESWYADKQEYMKNNELLVKFREGRNKVVKQQMLKSKSTATVGLFRGYRIKIGMDDIKLDPFVDSTQLLNHTKSWFIPLMLDEKHSEPGEQIGIIRKWLVEDLGNDEVAGLCYKAWMDIGKIVEDAHRLLKYEFKYPIFDIDNIESKFIILESDIDPSLPEKWGW